MTPTTGLVLMRLLLVAIFALLEAGRVLAGSTPSPVLAAAVEELRAGVRNGGGIPHEITAAIEEIHRQLHAKQEATADLKMGLGAALAEAVLPLAAAREEARETAHDGLALLLGALWNTWEGLDIPGQMGRKQELFEAVVISPLLDAIHARAEHGDALKAAATPLTAPLAAAAADAIAALPFRVATAGEVREELGLAEGELLPGAGGIGEPVNPLWYYWARAFFNKGIQDSQAIASWYAATFFNSNERVPDELLADFLLDSIFGNPVGLPLALLRLREAYEEGELLPHLEAGGGVVPLRSPWLVGLRPLLNIEE